MARMPWRALPALLIVAVAACVAAAPPAAADTPWGNTGASYSGGITCRLGATTVPLTTWDVTGTPTYSTADVSETGGAYGPAPTSGPSAPIRSGDGGMDPAQFGALAYLIAHHGSGSAAEIAEVSADVAAAAGSGGLQSRCLGQQGTSRARASSLFSQAQRYAGPYKVQLSLPTRAQPNMPVTIAAQVTSAAGFPTPGIGVTFAVDGGQAVAGTANDGIARTNIVTPSRPSTPITATVSEPVSLTYFSTDPGAVTVAAPVSATGTATLAPVLHPTPHVTTQAPGLVLHSSSVTPKASITGTFGYAGNGSISLLGPLHPATGRSCSAFGSGDWATAPVAWHGNFGFVGDGTHDAGASPTLDAGCYAVTATITTTNTSPPATATSGYSTTLVASDLALSESTGPGVAPAGQLTAVVTAADAAGAAVKTSITVHGPLAPADGTCSSTLDWSAAQITSVTDAQSLGRATTAPTPSSAPIGAPANTAPSAAPGGTGLSATIRTPTVSSVGCYALSSRSTVSQNGQTIVVEPKVGGPGTTVLVAQPALTIADAHYDGQLDKPMTGTITVVGSYRFAGKLMIGLRSAPRTDVGCREATFGQSVAQSGAVVTSVTTGDGAMRFTTPPARRNVCYAVTAVLSLTANPAVQASSPAPTTSSIFLAGVVLRNPKAVGIPGGDSDALLRTAIVAGICLLVLLAVALSVIGRAFSRRNMRMA